MTALRGSRSRRPAEQRLVATKELGLDQPPSILVVDDNEANRDILRRRLERHGNRVTLAVDGPDALRQINAEAFDLVILDVMMPGIDGLEVLRQVRGKHNAAQLPIIMATARDQSEDVVRALSLGASDYVTKPLDFSVVLARVQTQLALKRSVSRVLDLERRLAERNAELEAANERLLQDARQNRLELETAAKVQAAFLPTGPLIMPGARYAFAIEPCAALAGDALNIIRLEDGSTAFYVLDVSGHGVAASLLAVAATRILSENHEAAEPNGSQAHWSESVQPARVADRLDRRLPWNGETQQFLTLFYARFEPASGKLSYCSAGHPPAILVSPDSPPRLLSGTGLPIGIGVGNQAYGQQAETIRPKDRVYLYSDGITEAMDAGRQLFGIDRLMETLCRNAPLPLQQSIDGVLQEVRDWRGGLPPRDDISIVALECL